LKRFYFAAIAVSLLIAFTATYFASTSPDGLEKYLYGEMSAVSEEQDEKTTAGGAVAGTLAVLAITFTLGRLILGFRRNGKRGKRN